MARKNLEGLPDKTKEAPAEATAETSNTLEIVQDDDSTEGADSQEESLINEAKKGSSGAGRTRVYAILVYEDSAPDDWRERLTQEHVAALISPYHDKDVNPDGSQKKPHWHVMIMFDGPKSQEQVNGLWDRVLGGNRVKHYETVNSTRGYGRYLCHMDNPEKAQYSKDDVQALGGADYEEVISLPCDDYAVLDEIQAHLEEGHHRYYSDFMRYCRRERRDWWKLLVKRYSYMVVSWFRSERYRREDAREEQRLAEYGLRVDPATGELLARRETSENGCQD